MRSAARSISTRLMRMVKDCNVSSCHDNVWAKPMLPMKFIRHIRGHTGMRLPIMLLIAVLPLPALADDEHVRVTLLSENSALIPGATAWLGVRLQHEPHWHTYWINPGDSGLPTKLSWQLPPGFRAEEIVWPAPQ